jgi:UDP-glucuronate decarboxylase
MIELAQLVIELTNSNSKLSFRALPQDDPLQRKPIIELAKKELSWEPRIALKDGLLKTINYFDSIV